MMKKQPTATQQKLIDNGAAERTITIRYESSSYGETARRETVKATFPDLGDGHPTFQAGRDTYIIANNAIYRAQTRNIEPHWDRQADDLHETFYMETKDKAKAVSEAYDNEYSNSVVVNGCVSRLVNKTLYAHLMGDGHMYVVDDLDTDLGDYIDGEYVRVTSQKIGSWRVPLIHAAKLRDAYRQRMNGYGVDGDLAGDETANIPFTDDAVAAALTANAEGAQWGVDTGVYVPTIEEMDAADALREAFRGVEGGYGKVNSLATARRIADALAAYEETRKGATIL